MKKRIKYPKKVFDFFRRNRLKKVVMYQPYFKERKRYKRIKRLRLREEAPGKFTLAANKQKILILNANFKNEASRLFKIKKRKRNITSLDNLKIKVKRTVHTYNEVIKILFKFE